MKGRAIQPYMLQGHPAFRTQIAVLRATFGDRVEPTLPADRWEHERWRTSLGPLGRVHRFRERFALQSSGNPSQIGYFTGSFRPYMFPLLDKFAFAYLDADDPLSLYRSADRNHVPGNDFQRHARSLSNRRGKLRVSFWSDVQLAGFMANFDAAEAAALLDTEIFSTLPPAILPQSERSNVGQSGHVKCLAIASGKFWHKGIPDAIVAVDRLAQAGYPISLTLVGAQVPTDWIAFLAARPHFTLQSHLSRRDLDLVFQSHDLLIFPSHHDTYGWVILEAKSFGMPTLATDCYNRREIVADGHDGLLVREPFNNPWLPVAPVPYAAAHIHVAPGNRLNVGHLLEPYVAELEAALLRLVGDQALLQQLGSNALAAVQPHGPFGAVTRGNRLARHFDQPAA